jgi:hypothetical protein
MTPLGALKCLIDDRVIQHVLNRAKVFNAEHNFDTKYTSSSFWRYFSAVIGHGVVQYSEERDAYVAEKSSISGLLSNDFLRSLHTFNEWQSAKQAFTGNREQLTQFFNEASENLWTPSQYVQNPFSLLSSVRIPIIYVFREQAIDEGGIPTFANLEERKYTPGKPHPNAVEFFLAVGSDNWASNMMWPDDKREKYGVPENRSDQITRYVDYFKHVHNRKIQPHIFYIDARWSSLKLMDVIYKSGCYGVLSCSVKMRPQKLMTWMRSDLGKGDWWSVGYSPAKANLITIRTKKKVYLNILTNYATLAQVGVQKRKRKYPCGTYQVNAPFVQKNYNQHKCAVDKWNKALLEYYRLARFVNDDVMYT